MTDSQKPLSCSLPEPLSISPHLEYPPYSLPLTVGSVLVAMKVSFYLQLSVPGRERRALGRKEDKAGLQPAWIQDDLCSRTQAETHIFC